MEIFGFLIFTLIGIIFLGIGVLVLLANSVLGGNKKGDIFMILVFLGLACWILNWSYHNSPFSVTIK